MPFRTLHEVLKMRRALRSFTPTPECFDLVCAIGYYQELGRPLTLEKLLALEIASVPTLHRRLRRLRKSGAVMQRRSERDARVVEFLLSPAVKKALERYGDVLRAP